MDNTSSTTTSEQSPFNSTHLVVTLNSAQYAFYQQTYLELQAPDSKHLEYVGKFIRQEYADNHTLRLRNRVSLLACLFENINDEINLSIPAVLELTDLLGQVREVYTRLGR